MQDLNNFKKHLSEPSDIVITTHQNPDADALGSSQALAQFLRKKGNKVSVISPTDFPKFLNWMNHENDVITFNEGNEKKSQQLVEEADFIFCLDFSSLNRINELGEMVRGSKAKKVLIDHHLEPEDFADFSFWDVQAAATAEIVYELIVNLGDRLLIDTEIANCLYAGIMTDTGGFKHPNTTRRVFEVAADLIELGANTAGVANWIYDSNTEDRIRLLGFSLSERLKIIPEFSTAYISLSAEDLSKFKSQTGDTEGIVNYALSIVGIKFAALITERNNMIKMSFRSMGEFSVNEFARKHFSGGGHKNAAGGKSESSLAETVKKFEEVLKEYKEILSSNDSTKILT